MKNSQKQPSVTWPDSHAFITTVVSIFAFVALSSPALASDNSETWVSDTLTGEHKKQQFVAGERVEVTNANIADDVFAAGNDLRFDSVSAELIVAAGASVWFTNVIADDLILAGGEMNLSGKVADDVVAAVCPVCPMHGRLHLTSAMQIGDDARLAGREIIIDGQLGGDLYAAAQHVQVSGQIAGNASIQAERIVLTPGARIGGDLRYAGPAAPELGDGAVVVGRIVKVEPTISFAEERHMHWAWYGVLAVLGFLAALVLLGVVLQLVMPGLISSAAATARTALWASLGRGLVIALLVPALVVLLMITVIGAPIGVVGIASLVLLYALAFAAICYCIGLYVRRLFGTFEVGAGAGPRILWTTVGILVLIIVGLIPLIGWAIGFLAIICGLGAVASQLGRVFRLMRDVSASD